MDKKKHGGFRINSGRKPKKDKKIFLSYGVKSSTIEKIGVQNIKLQIKIKVDEIEIQEN